MKKNLKDYLHLYIGCKIYWGDGPHNGTLTGSLGYLTECNYRAEIRTKTKGKNSYEYFTPLVEQCKPVLRPLSSMTEDESKEFDERFGDSFEDIIDAAEQTRYLLSKHFDLFGLLESGLAIDATTITSKPA